MRIKRVTKFRKLKHKKIRKFILFTFILPTTSILLGYLITYVFILPSLSIKP